MKKKKKMYTKLKGGGFTKFKTLLKVYLIGVSFTHLLVVV